MDMSGMSGMSGMQGPSDSTNSHMQMNSNFMASVPNVPLWFSGWQPANAGSTMGACFGLFALAILNKILGALRQQAHLAWSINHAALVDTNTFDKEPIDSAASNIKVTKPTTPWNAQQDIPRGVLAALHASIGYFLMLAVMTYNIYYFIAIILGYFCGEVIFGRWGGIHVFQVPASPWNSIQIYSWKGLSSRIQRSNCILKEITREPSFNKFLEGFAQ
ncbi:hypothetical protein O181_036250 [Austropuccinia psidii MF-1]|uniref:Copper transport protein n=1 Tax=Austropuccinia psidii MF-1 TaxID=1389203 RepID=A0A9Q3D8K9_9BASI|nr:hypothetical protein [Austropuccinia psidii MF-1]